MFFRNIKEVNELFRLFNIKGFRTVSINSKNDINIEEFIERLEQDVWKNGLDYIITADMFNEGIEFPGGKVEQGESNEDVIIRVIKMTEEACSICKQFIVN